MLPIPPEKAFVFFEDPWNLYDITPDWLQFKLISPEKPQRIHEGSEFEYTVKWLGLVLRWRSRIVDHHPPGRFTDIQVAGPYESWVHLHTFEPVPDGTLMRDRVDYRLPMGLAGRLLHAVRIERQLEDIFSCRAVRIDQWARGITIRKPLK
jgi:ligand-binding SRPBCC domain-containing protein